MKRNDVKQLATMDVSALQNKLQELRKSYIDSMNARMKRAEKNVHISYGIKKDIARVLTILKQKEMGL